MVAISAQAEALFGADAVAHVWTNNADGTPQVSVVWVIARGDDTLGEALGRNAMRKRARAPVASDADEFDI